MVVPQKREEIQSVEIDKKGVQEINKINKRVKRHSISSIKGVDIAFPREDVTQAEERERKRMKEYNEK